MDGWMGRQKDGCQKDGLKIPQYRYDINQRRTIKVKEIQNHE